MFCEKCGNEIKEGEKFCGKCGSTIGQGENKNTVISDVKSDNNQSSPLIKIILYIIAIIVVIMFFKCAGDIADAGSSMASIRSVGGETIAEAYYQDYGSFIKGIATVVRGIGITCGIVIGYIGKKF